MLRRWWSASAAVVLALALSGWAQEGQVPPQVPKTDKQDDKFRPEAPKEGEEEEELTPEQAMAMLKEVRGLMDRSEELLNDSARGKSLETEAEILKKIDTLLKDDPSAAQKQIVQKIEKLLGKTEGGQKESVDKITEIIRKAKS